MTVFFAMRIGGWLVLLPPVTEKDDRLMPNYDAPFLAWTQVKAYERAEECEKDKTQVLEQMFSGQRLRELLELPDPKEKAEAHKLAKRLHLYFLKYARCLPFSILKQGD